MTLDYLALPVTQPMWGPQQGIGRAEAADWWLNIVRAGADETEAAATPAKTIESAKTRTVSFIIGNPSLDMAELGVTLP